MSNVEGTKKGTEVVEGTPNGTEIVKTNITGMLNVPAQTSDSPTQEESPKQEDSLEPKTLYDEFSKRFDKANTRLLNACRKIAAENNETLFVNVIMPTAGATTWNVQRYVPALNRKEAKITGKEAKKYRTVLGKANLNLVELEKLAVEAEGKTPLGKAEKEVEKQKAVVKSLTEIEDNAKKALGNLKVPAESRKCDGQTVTQKDTIVNDTSLKFVTGSYITGLKTKKNKTQKEQFDLDFNNKIESQRSEFNRLTKELETATNNTKVAQKELDLKNKAVLAVEQIEAKRLETFNEKKASVKKAIDLLIVSGNCFNEDHKGFLDKLSEIDTTTKKNESFESGVESLESLEIDVKSAADNLQLKVISEASTANNELDKVTDPVALSGDPVRKKRVDEARELIAKRLREPLVGSAVVAARSEIPAFAELVEEIDEQLEKRPNQDISYDRLKLVYGEPLSKLAAKSTGDGAVEYLDESRAKLATNLILDVPGKKILIVAGPTTNYKAAEVEVEVEVEKDSPIIVWRPPVPILQHRTLTDKTLNAKLKNSFGQLVNAPNPALTFDPTRDTLMATLEVKTLKANFAGNANYKAAATVQVDVKVVANETELGKESAMSGRALKEPTIAVHKQLLDKWNTDDSEKGLKKQSKKVMSDIQDMTPDELIAYMDDFISATGDGFGGGKILQGNGQNLNMIWFLENGLQVRYKPFGKLRPPPPGMTAPMFSIEGKTCNIPNVPSTRNVEADIAFKLTLNGEPGPYGPDQTILPDGIQNDQGQAYKNFMDAACGTTHLKCKPKLEQVITWANPPDITDGQRLREASLPQAEDFDALEFTNANGPVTLDTIMLAGKEQVLRVKGKETLRYLASANYVEVKINVKKVQPITWNPLTKELDAGTPLGDDFLNAKVEDNAVLSYFYYDGTKDNPIDGKTVLHAGKGLTLKVLAAATDSYHPVIVPTIVTIDVNRKSQEVTWNPLKKELDAGTKLGDEVLNAVSSSGDKPVYYKGSDVVTETTVLPLGDHELKAVAGETNLYAESAPKIVTISVKPKKESI